MKKTCVLAAALAAAVVLIDASTSQAQTAPSVKYPDDNVRGGAISSRRPGLWTSAGIGNYVERKNVIFNDRGGADPQPDDGSTDDVFRKTFIISFLEGLFSTIESMFTQLGTSLLTGTTGTGTTTGT